MELYEQWRQMRRLLGSVSLSRERVRAHSGMSVRLELVGLAQRGAYQPARHRDLNASRSAVPPAGASDGIASDGNVVIDGPKIHRDRRPVIASRR
jgi:hypothetical protein